jgi:hypothetical protein
MKQFFFLAFLLLTHNIYANNIFVVGAELGVGEGSEKFTTNNGDASIDFISLPSFKVTTAYKITDHHLRLSYLYNHFDNDDSYQALSLGYKYDFRGLSIIKNEYFNLIPTLSYDTGISFEKEKDLKGWINEVEAGFSLEFSPILSLTCNYSASVIFWDGSDQFDDVIDRVNERAFKIGILYNFGAIE